MQYFVALLQEMVYVFRPSYDKSVFYKEPGVFRNGPLS